jgi:hypothetical protein
VSREGVRKDEHLRFAFFSRTAISRSNRTFSAGGRRVSEDAS